jgi:G:T-mismatch repair DNA endonuclease (very short patch repair protein)
VLVTRFLRTHGWKVLRIWQCDLRLERRIVKRLKIALRRQ